MLHLLLRTDRNRIDDATFIVESMSCCCSYGQATPSQWSNVCGRFQRPRRGRKSPLHHQIEPRGWTMYLSVTALKGASSAASAFLVLSFSSRGSSWTKRSQDANHESHNRHVLALWNEPLQSLIVQRIWVHPYAAIPMFAAAQRAQMDLQRSQTHTRLEDRLYPMVECELQASAVGRVRHEPQAARGIDSTSRSCTWPK